MGYAGVRCFAVELTGRWRGTVWGENGAPHTHTEYASREEAAGKSWCMLSPLWRLPDGREVTSDELPPGSVYTDEHGRKGPDGLSVVAVCPDGTHWHIDERATNCTAPDDLAHHCWCRHGDPRNPASLHVDKNGLTCKAGAGSIQTAKYHGKLENGAFTDG